MTRKTASAKRAPRKSKPKGLVGYPVEQVTPGSLTPHPRNYREHPDTQLDHIAASIREHGFYRNVVISSESVILAGHGVVQACVREGFATIPVIRVPVRHDSPQALKILTGDNEMGALATSDDAKLAEILAAIHEQAPDDGLSGTGFDPGLLALLDGATRPVAGLHGALAAATAASSATPQPEKYTKTVKSPVYEPTMDEPPAIGELFDRDKSDELSTAIRAADLPDELRDFLLAAAQRHTAFRYDRIAEYYAHAEPEVQRLMEDSALVVIDFDKAIENGFVVLSEAVTAAFETDYPDA